MKCSVCGGVDQGHTCCPPTEAVKRFGLEPLAPNGIVKGWRVVRLSDGAFLGPFNLKREAEILIDFFGEEVKKVD